MAFRTYRQSRCRFIDPNRRQKCTSRSVDNCGYKVEPTGSEIAESCEQRILGGKQRFMHVQESCTDGFQISIDLWSIYGNPVFPTLHGFRAGVILCG